MVKSEFYAIVNQYLASEQITKVTFPASIGYNHQPKKKIYKANEIADLLWNKCSEAGFRYRTETQVINLITDELNAAKLTCEFIIHK